mgnify:CR=1 FL=1
MDRSHSQERFGFQPIQTLVDSIEPSFDPAQALRVVVEDLARHVGAPGARPIRRWFRAGHSWPHPSSGSVVTELAPPIDARPVIHLDLLGRFLRELIVLADRLMPPILAELFCRHDHRRVRAAANNRGKSHATRAQQRPAVSPSVEFAHFYDLWLGLV